MTMTLNPATYTCPEHQIDLTDQVEEELGGDAPPVAYIRGLLLGKSGPASRPFEVIVTCPGTADDGSHTLTCSGTCAP